MTYVIEVTCYLLAAVFFALAVICPFAGGTVLNALTIGLSGVAVLICGRTERVVRRTR